MLRFAPLLLLLALASPVAALITAACAALAAASATAIQLWFRSPMRRSMFRRRQVASRLATLSEAFVSIMWAGVAAATPARRHGHTRHQLNDHRCEQHLLAVESIRYRAGEQPKNDEGERLQEASESQLKGRARELIDLVEVGDVANLDGQRGQDASHPKQPKVVDEQGRPRPDRLVFGRGLIYFGAVIQSVGQMKPG